MQNKEYQSTLRRCPFCGGEARKNAQTVKGFRLLYVECKRCGATGSIIRTDKPRVKDEDNMSIKAWNKRAGEQE